jgi:oligopeptide/dipeptide ABC transporter ATP-binding protein
VSGVASAGSILDVRHLEVSFLGETHATRVVRGIDLAVRAGETVALVGESGSGKSASVLGLLGLLPAGAARVEARSVEFTIDGRVVDTPADYLGSQIGVVFQDPQSCLNPTMRIGKQIGEVLRRHRKLDRRQITARVLASLDDVGIPDPVKCADSYPHQLSGGMRQRVMIAMATISRPALLVADEPTTALDTTLQSQIIDTILERQRSDGAGLLFITHDLALVSGFADRILVMYAGEVVETGPASEVINHPAHPYTRALLASVPMIEGEAVRPIRGNPPVAGMIPAGCPFHPRCDRAEERCRTDPPPRVPVGGRRAALCWFADEPAEAGDRG